MATVTGLFDSPADAQSAVRELIDAGWRREEIGLVTASQGTDGSAEITGLAVKDAEKGAVIGGLAGLFLGLSELAAIPGIGPVLVGGWLVATLLGAGVGAAAGGLVGSLVELGLSHEEAGHIAEGVRTGGTLVTVKADAEKVRFVEEVLTRCNAVTPLANAMGHRAQPHP